MDPLAGLATVLPEGRRRGDDLDRHAGGVFIKRISDPHGIMNPGKIFS